MDKDENVFKDELDSVSEEESAEPEEVTEEDSEDEFEYDEDGNIIIPDIEYDEEDEEEADKEADTPPDESAPEGEEADESATEDTKEEVPEEANTSDKEERKPREPDARELELIRLRRYVERLEQQSKDTLEKLGVKNGDIMEGLVSLAAEAEGISTEEYVKRRDERDRDIQARRLLRKQEFQRIAEKDLAELQATYPETKAYKHIFELPDGIRERFGRFRDKGLSAKEAYAAADPDGIRTSVAEAVRKQSLHDTKSHLHTAVPKGSKDDGISMPKSELVKWRELFPNMSDKEIRSLYRSTAN